MGEWTVSHSASRGTRVPTTRRAAVASVLQATAAGRASYAQVRMTGLIAEFTERRPDPDGGRVRLRLMTALADAPGILGWGEPAVAQAKATARVAKEVRRLPVDSPAPDVD
jgi:hypothetical protein